MPYEDYGGLTDHHISIEDTARVKVAKRPGRPKNLINVRNRPVNYELGAGSTINYKSTPMDNKQLIEKHVAKLFLERTENILISDDDLLFGDHLKNEPDILYKEKGIEIGAVLRGTNTHIDNYEKEFLYRASEAIKGKIPETLQIRLVMQDDNGTVEHTPSAEFQGYKHLPKYLDGIFIYQSENRQVKDKVVLINEYNSLNIYEGIYFLDFSMP